MLLLSRCRRRFLIFLAKLDVDHVIKIKVSVPFHKAVDGGDYDIEGY